MLMKGWKEWGKTIPPIGLNEVENVERDNTSTKTLPLAGKRHRTTKAKTKRQMNSSAKCKTSHSRLAQWRVCVCICSLYILFVCCDQDDGNGFFAFAGGHFKPGHWVSVLCCAVCLCVFKRYKTHPQLQFELKAWLYFCPNRTKKWRKGRKTARKLNLTDNRSIQPSARAGPSFGV